MSLLFQFFLFFFLLFLLFLLSQKITTLIYSFSYLVSNNKKFSIGVLIILLLPGTIIHEFSHFILATILRVPTGELSILPTTKKSGEVKLGKLHLGKTDPFRQTLIGLAPILIGLILIYFFGKLFLSNFLQLITQNRELNTFSLFFLFSIFYFLFSISTTMFSSKKDLESLAIALPIALLMLASLYLTGIRILLEKTLINKITIIFAYLNYFLLITAILNFIIYLFLIINVSLWQKIFRRKIIPW